MFEGEEESNRSNKSILFNFIMELCLLQFINNLKPAF